MTTQAMLKTLRTATVLGAVMAVSAGGFAQKAGQKSRSAAALAQPPKIDED